MIWIDWWSKYVWLAYYKEDWNDIVLPIWYILNDASFFFNFSDLIFRYNISKIVIWYPKNWDEVKEKIDEFIKQLKIILWEDFPIIKQNEDFTTTQAWELIWNYRKNESTDTIAAMKILENYKNS